MHFNLKLFLMFKIIIHVLSYDTHECEGVRVCVHEGVDEGVCV